MPDLPERKDPFVSDETDYREIMAFGTIDQLDDFTVKEMGRQDRADGAGRDDSPFDDPIAIKLWQEGWDDG